MIRYDLKCADGHGFEAWFASAAAFDEQAARGLVNCALCGSPKVEKALMAPRLPRKDNARTAAPPAAPQGSPSPPSSAPTPMLNAPVPPEIERRLTALRREIEAKSDYVGKSFAAEARKIHEGESEARSIYGEATAEEAKSLVEDGVPVAPLPVRIKHDG